MKYIAIDRYPELTATIVSVCLILGQGLENTLNITHRQSVRLWNRDTQ